MAGRDAFGLETIRSAVQKRADETSLHGAADEIGMSYTGIRHFLGGGKPHPRTRKKLVHWFARVSGGAAKRLAERGGRYDIDAAVSLIAIHIRSETSQVMRRRRLNEIVRRISDEADVAAE